MRHTEDIIHDLIEQETDNDTLYGLRFLLEKDQYDTPNYMIFCSRCSTDKCFLRVAKGIGFRARISSQKFYIK